MSTKPSLDDALSVTIQFFYDIIGENGVQYKNNRRCTLSTGFPSYLRNRVGLERQNVDRAAHGLWRAVYWSLTGGIGSHLTCSFPGEGMSRYDFRKGSVAHPSHPDNESFKENLAFFVLEKYDSYVTSRCQDQFEIKIGEPLPLELPSPGAPYQSSSVLP